MTAKQGDTVRIHYTGKLEDGTVFDTSEGREPIEFTIGQGQVIPGFEEGVTDMAEGEEKSVSIEPENAYGPKRDELIQDVPRTQFPEDAQVEEGAQFQARTQTGQTINLTVVDVKEDVVTVDGNHPLAGQTLNFDLKLEKIVG
ncbi:MAG: peptidylprolyl isomerase [Xanthomonadales bacterium]|nr:peptidylprolyl isomerase [Xanthomonadales bacterium]